MRIYKIAFIVMIFFAGCRQEDQLFPKSTVNCNINYNTHPKNQQYQAILDKYAKKGFVGISLLVDHPVDGVWEGAAGYANIENKVRMTPCHIGYAASISKTFIAVMIMQLAEQNVLSLDDNLDNWIDKSKLDKIPNGHRITVRQLLSHRSGLPDIFEIDFILDFLNKPTKWRTADELLSYLYNVKAKSTPGTAYYYSDGNFLLLSYILEKQYGSLNQAFSSNIFSKVVMPACSLLNDPKSPPVGIVANYFDRFGNGYFENVSDWQLALTAAATGKGTDALLFDLKGMNNFLHGMNNGTLIRQSSLDLMKGFLDIPEKDQKQGFVGYGLGLGKVQVTGNIWYGHFGNHIGSGAIALYNPAKNVYITAITNTGTFFSDKTKDEFFGRFIADIEAVALY